MLTLLWGILLVSTIFILSYLDSTGYFVKKKPKRYKSTSLSSEHNLYLFKFIKQDYMRSSVWDDKRKSILSIAHYTCESCGASGVPLDVHHTGGYNLIPNEGREHLVALCRDCHTHQHQHYGYPQTYEDYMSWNAPLIKKD